MAARPVTGRSSPPNGCPSRSTGRKPSRAGPSSSSHPWSSSTGRCSSKSGATATASRSSRATTTRIAAQFAAVFFKEPPGKDGNYNVMHSSQVFVVDKAGRLRASFVNASIEDMATITSLLIEETG